MGKYIKIAEDRVVEMYLSNDYKMSEICSYFGVSKMKIRSVLKNKNIESKTSKKYSYNENVFENIDNEESAYWLGFLYADGYVRYREKYGSELRLKLSVRDKDHLLKFKKFITSDDIPVVYEEYKKSKSYKISINSKKIVSDLIKLGCVSRKSLIIEFPKIDDKLKNHFIRGYFDGDGSISHSNKYIGLNFISGSYKFLSELSEQIEIIGCKNANLVGGGENYKYIQYSSHRDLKLLIEFLYNKSNIHLDRKKEKFIYIINNFEELNIIKNEYRKQYTFNNKERVNKKRRDRYVRSK